jgi:hypothetical protein
MSGAATINAKLDLLNTASHLHALWALSALLRMLVVNWDLMETKEYQNLHHVLVHSCH